MTSTQESVDFHIDRFLGSRQDIFQFFSGEFKYYRYVKFPDVRGALIMEIILTFRKGLSAHVIILEISRVSDYQIYNTNCEKLIS